MISDVLDPTVEIVRQLKSLNETLSRIPLELAIQNRILGKIQKEIRTMASGSL